ncbi:MAG TPA: hypothetical protein VJQ09_03575 [Candidatus Limnocylindria bacterium]|nr:hypothetical protein [Candidatus Limnocylindria bacterium]
MKRIRAALTSVALVLVMLTSGSYAWAGPQWCEEDPEFLVNGALVDASMLFPYSYKGSVSSVNFDLQIPSNATAVVLSLPGTVPVTASISRTLPAYHGLLQVPVVLTVTAKTNAKFDTYTQVLGTGGAIVNWTYGTSPSTKMKFNMYGL